MKTLVIASACVLAAPALAQELNVDFGNASGVPASTYLGAACKPGNWNTITSFPASNLVDTSGTSVPNVTVSCSLANPTFLTQTTPNNNSKELYEDYIEIPQVTSPITFTIAGLDGSIDYDLYFYAWHANEKDTRVRVQPITTWSRIGGVYPVGFDHQNYLTYHWYRVPAGTTSLVVEVMNTATNLGAVNGFQLRERNEVGTNYCTGQGSMSAIGSANASGDVDISAGDLQLIATGLPPMHQQYGLFAMSFENTGTITIPTGGMLCFDSAFDVYRFPNPSWMDIDGTLRTCFPFDHFQTTLQLALAGQEVHVQAWYRDLSGTNTTDALTLTFQ